MNTIITRDADNIWQILVDNVQSNYANETSSRKWREKEKTKHTHTHKKRPIKNSSMHVTSDYGLIALRYQSNAKLI